MGMQLVPEFDPPLPGEGFGSDGKLLYWALDTLDRLARAAGVPPLSTYLDGRPEPADMDEWDDPEEWLERWPATRPDWHSPADGARTVEGVLALLGRDGPPARLDGRLAAMLDAPELVAGLPEVLEPAAACLRRAAAAGARFRLDLV
jgi:hypothetical protein